MNVVFESLQGIIIESWNILVASSLYVLIGFLLAGCIKALLPEGMVAKFLGADSFGSVVKASLIGVPLPLCSCSVIPTAVALKRRGASDGATAAFMISTPETGVDSIAITWALMDPVMTLLRPLAAFVTATISGWIINVIPSPRGGMSESAAAGST